MQAIVIKYLSEKVLDDFRSGRIIEKNISKALSKYPLIDLLRQQVEEGDIPTLITASQITDNDFGLIISLLRKFDTRKDVREFLLAQWKKENDYGRKIQLMWRLLDDIDLSSQIQNEIYAFVMNNFEQFTNDSADWFGGADQVLDGVRSRLSDPGFPKTKDWAYLCVAVSSSDKASVVELLRAYINDKNDFLRKVANDLMQKLE